MNLRKSLRYYLALNSYVEKVQSIGDLPGEYIRLEYLESSGTQYINTGIKVKENTFITSKFMFTNSTTASKRLFGKIAGPSTAAMNYRETGTFYWFGSINIAASSDSVHIIDFNADGKIYRDGIQIGTKGTAVSLNDTTIYLFAEISDNNTINYGQVKVYDFTIKEDSVVVQNLIPARRKADGELGMFDTVSGTFLTNDGTGDFIAGPSTTDFKDAIHNGLISLTAKGKAIQPAKNYLDTVIASGGTELVPADYIDSATAKGKTQLRRVPSDYEELEYVTFDGTQIVDTGLYISQDDEIQSKFYGTTNQSWVYGTGPDNPRITCYLASTGNQRWGNVAKDSTGITYNVMNTVIQNKTAFTINGTSYAFPAGSDFTTALTLTLGNCNTSTGTPYFSGNFYYMKIYNADRILVQNLVPAKRKFDNTIGFYDTVNNSFIVPSTGTLIAGPSIDISSDYTRLAYLTGDGAAYIDLGISLTQEDEFELDFIMPSSSVSMQNIFGYRNSASSNAITAMIASTSDSFVTDFNNSDYSPYRLLTNVSAATAYKVITNKNNRFLYQGDTLVDSNTTLCGDTITTGNVLVFNIGGSPAYTNKFTGSISKVIVKNRMNLIPAKRNSDGVLGMYDIINNQFYTNAAETGAFIAGPEISSSDPNAPLDIYCNNGKLIKTVNEANYIASNVTMGYWLRNSDGQPEVSSANFYTNMIPVKPDTSYVCFGRNKLDNTLSQYNRIAWYDSTGTWISNCTYTVNTVTVATSPANAAYARFHCNATTSTITQEIIDGYNWTFCEGTEEVAYTPYITTSTQEILQDASGNMAVVQNLLQLDSTYQDTQEILTGVVTGKIGMLIVDGINEGRKIGTAWNATYKRGSFAVAGMLSTAYSVVDAICGHFKYATDVYGSPTTPGFCTNNGTIFFSFASMDNITSAAEANAWFEAQYRAGTPVIVLYPLTTATSTAVASQVLKTEPVYVAQGGLDNLAVDVISSTKTVPAPNYPLDIRCNNGVFKSLLPSDYIELDYVENTNNSVIDTLIVPNANTKFVLDAQVVDRVTTSGNSAVLFGNTEGSWDKQSTVRMEADIFRLRAYVSSSSTDTVTSDTNRHTFVIDIKNGYSVIDNTTLATWTPGFGTATSTLKLFGGYWSSAYQFFAKAKVYSAKIYENDVLVMNLVPAKKKSTNKIGFYDTISGNFFSNIYTSGSELSAGNVVPKVIGTTETLVDFNGTINLFDKDTNPYISAYVHATTGVLTQGTGQYCFCIPCKPRTTYFLSGMNGNLSAWGSFTSNAINTTATTFVKGDNTLTTGPNDQYLIGLAYANGTSYDYRDTLNIVEYTSTMNTATIENLFKVGTYADTQEVLSGTITRNIEIIVFNGTENWGASNTYPGSCWLNLTGNSRTNLCICSHFENSVNGTSSYTRYKALNEGYAINLWYGDNKDTAVADLKAFLADQYAKGTPVVLLRALTTATTESVSAQTLVTPPVSIKQASMSGLTVNTTQTNVTVPTPARPLDIYCNNGKLGLTTFPGGYTPVEYLQSSGTQYIDLGIKGNGNTKIEVEWMWYEESDVSTSGRVIGGRYTDSPYNAWAIGTNTGKTTVTSSNTIFLQYYGSAAVDPSLVKNTIVVPIGSWTHIIRSKDECIINGTDYGSSTAHTFETPYNLHLFAFAQSTSSSSTPTIGCGIGRCKYLKIWNGDTLVLDLVPVVSSDGTLGMYNKVNGDFLTNGGTGTFTAGPTIINTTGTPETITIYSKNLFNKSDITTGKILNDTGAEVAQSAGYYSGHISVNANTEYTISQTGGEEIYLRILEYDSTDTMVKLNKGTQAGGTQTKTFTTGDTTTYVIVSGSTKSNALNTLQLEEDYRPTVYEEYGSQTLSVQDLLSISGYEDTQSIMEGIVNKKVCMLILTGKESWQAGQSANKYYLTVDNIYPHTQDWLPICTHFKGQVGSLTGSGECNPDSTCFYIGSSGGTSTTMQLYMALSGSTKTVSEFKAWLAEQYAAGTPVIVLYPLVTATTENVDAQYSGLTAGHSNAEITGSIDGLTAEVCYKKLK